MEGFRMSEEKKNDEMETVLNKTEDDWEEQVKNAGERGVNPISELAGAVLLFAVGVYVFLTSIKMPAQTLSGGVWYVAPGVFPALMGIILCILCVVQGIMSWKKYRKADYKKNSEEWSRNRVISMLIIAAMLCTYVFLLGTVPYRLLTFLFMGAASVYFDNKHDWKHILIDLVISAVTAFVVAYCFANFAHIPLP